MVNLSMRKNEKLRIGIVYDFAYPFTKGGAEYRYYLLAKYLISRGHSITWFTMNHWNGSTQIIKNGIKYVGIIPCIKVYKKGKRALQQTIRFGFGSIKLFNKIDDIDILDISQYPFLHFFPLYVFSKIKQKPTVVSWYEYWGKDWKTAYPGFIGKIGRLIEWLMAKLSNQIIVVSKQSQNRLLIEGIKKDRLNYIPNWIDIEEINNAPAFGEQYDICYFGRLKDHKNVDLLLRAIAILKKKDLTLRVKILGDGPEKKNLQILKEELGLIDEVIFLGGIEKHEELLGYVKSAKVFVNPSTKEGGGSIVTLESNACSVPVIAVRSLLGIDDDLIIEGKNGFWAIDAKPESLADVIYLFFTESIKTIDNARIQSNLFARKYDISKLGLEVEDIYYNLLDKKVEK